MPTMKAYDFIDSHTDAVEGWSKFGADQEGVDPMLQEGVGALGALASEPQSFRLFAPVDQRQIMEEIEENPGFGKKLSVMLHQRDGARAVAASAKRAALNELDGSFPQSRGEWVTLRRRLRVLARDIPGAITKQIEMMSLPEKTRALRALASGSGVSFQLGAEAATTAAPTNIWSSIIGGIATAAATVYGAKLVSDANKDIAKIQASSAASSTAANAQIAQAQAALQAAQTAAAARSSGGEVGGIPIWAIPVGLGVLGIVLYFVLKR